ncbi:MAG: diacylglycerol kinase family protein [Anaerolineaceae bacterium]
MEGFFKKRRISFRFAFAGLGYALRTQKNTWVHLFFTMAAITAGWVLKISALEWAVIVVCIGLVWTAEMMNTAVEAVSDLACSELHPLAKICKDVAAGAVLVAAFTSVVTGLLIFGPPLYRLFFP